LSFLMFLFLVSTNFYSRQFICFVLLFMFGQVSCIVQTPYSYLLFFLFVTIFLFLLHALFVMFYSYFLHRLDFLYFYIYLFHFSDCLKFSFLNPLYPSVLGLITSRTFSLPLPLLVLCTLTLKYSCHWLYRNKKLSSFCPVYRGSGIHKLVTCIFEPWQHCH